MREESILTGAFHPAYEPYALAKVAGIKLCQYYRRQYNCDFISVIPSNLYGVQDNFDLQRANLIPSLIMKIQSASQNGQDYISIWGDGSQEREQVFVDDCSDAIVLLLDRYSGEKPVNIGTGKTYTVLEIAKIVADVMNVSLQFRTDPTKPAGVNFKKTDLSILNSLGWHPKVSLREGVRSVYQGLQKIGMQFE
jgi:GDP-L-fucose synthase